MGARLHGASHCQLYVDGSAKNSQAAWSVVVVWQDFLHGRTTLEGLFGDILADGPADISFLGESRTEAIHAEQSAVIFALLWIMQRSSQTGAAVRYSVHFDNIAAGNGASGVSSLPGDSCLSRIARGAAQLVEAAAGGCVRYSHVSAHEGHAWNELADTVAKTILGVLSSGGPSVPPPPRTVAALARCINWDWAWMYVQPHLAAAFPRVSEGLMSWDLDFEAPTVGPVTSCRCVLAFTASMWIRVRFAFASFRSTCRV